MSINNNIIDERGCPINQCVIIQRFLNRPARHNYGPAAEFKVLNRFDQDPIYKYSWS